MCGIAGFIDLTRNTALDKGVEIVTSMAQIISHRGPDDQGVWSSPKCGVFLAHRRLSILDLSQAGHQPMLSATGRYAIVFNGEVYNFLQIKEELNRRDEAWSGNSDTEVVLAAIERWGLDAALQKFVGMFAFALWDKKNECLTLVRDRFGEKPLYWAKFGGAVIFGSELKSLKKHPAFIKNINRASLARFIDYGYCTGNESIYDNVERVPSGSFYVFGLDGSFISRKYWSARGTALTAMNQGFEGDMFDATNKLESLISRSVQRQLFADVSVGAFLSGGIDSTTIVALAQSRSSSPIKTFTIGFDEEDYNEANYAAEVAKYLGTDHVEHYVSHKDVLAAISSLPSLYDEPFADPSQIPTFLVSKLAKTKVAVSLSGDGGDELFCGYNRYAVANRIMQYTNPLSSIFFKLVSKGIAKFPLSILDDLGAILGGLSMGSQNVKKVGEKIHRLSMLLGNTDDEARLYEAIIKQKSAVSEMVLGVYPANSLTNSDGWCSQLDFMHRMMLLDTASYLTDDILVKLDRASMGVSLESRVPFLDHKIFEFAWSLPLSMKVKGSQGKRVLREVLYRYVPRPLIDRQKKGFSVPIGLWLKGPLKDWALGLLDKNRLTREGFINVAFIQKIWAEHQRGVRNHEQILWRVLMFQIWLDENN